MPALLCWVLLVCLAVPALALAETEAPASGGPALIEDEAPPLDQYGTLPSGEEEISFVPEVPPSPAPSEAVAPQPVTPAPVDPSTDPAPVDPIPPEPVGEEPAPTEPVGEEPVGETPVEEPAVGSVIDKSPDQEFVDAPAYTPPVVALPAVEIPVAAADPLPAAVIPTENLVNRVEAQAPVAESPAPVSPAPIARPSEPLSRAVTIPSAAPSGARPADLTGSKPESSFATGPDLRSAPSVPMATPKQPDVRDLPGAGVTEEVANNPLLPRLTSPMGPTPSGSQLFEVLAQYVMAGGSGPPTSVALILLVQIATVVAAFALRAPRSMFQSIVGASDKLFVGYRAVALRPG